jgi:hypothetical protein
VRGWIWEYGVRHPDGYVLVLAVASGILLTITGFVFVLDVGVLAIILCTGSVAVWSVWNRLTGEQQSRRILADMDARKGGTRLKRCASDNHVMVDRDASEA